MARFVSSFGVMRLLLAMPFLVGACTKPPAPGPVVSPKVAPIVRAPSCGDAGVLLRGSVPDEDKLGKMKEELISKVCSDDTWDAKVLACVASKAVPAECLAQLTETQVTTYEAKLAAWHEQYGYGTGEEGGEEGGVVGGQDDPPPPDEGDWVACEDAVKHTAVWLPPITVTGDDRTFATGLRDREMIKLCNVDEWSTEVRTCLAAATEKTTVGCLIQLGASQQKSIATAITKADKLATKSIQLAAKPAKVGCKQVVAAHYSDAKWKTEAVEVKGAARKKLVDESRKKMTKACTDEKWPAAERACMIGDGSDACYGVAGRSSRWGFPAAGVMLKIGIPECDEYGALLTKLSACDKLPDYARGSLLESYTQTAMYWLKTSAEDRPAVATSCKSASDALRQSGEALGCSL